MRVVDHGTGTGPPLVLVHGVGLDHHLWDLVIPTFLDDGSGPREIIRYDLLGHGDDPTPPATGFADFVAQLVEVAEPSSTVVGLSLGGAIVRGALARHPGHFCRAVIANTVYLRSDAQRRANAERLELTRERGMAPIAELALDRWFTTEWQTEHPDRVAAIRDRISNTDLEGYLAAYRIFIDGDPDEATNLGFITDPVLVVTGDRDTGSTPAMTHAMAAAIPGARSHVMADTGHLPPIEHPDAFARTVLDFLESS